MPPAAIGRHAAMTARSRRTAFGQASELIELSHQTMTSTDAVAWNREMDASLASTGVVDQEVFAVSWKPMTMMRRAPQDGWKRSCRFSRHGSCKAAH